MENAQQGDGRHAGQLVLLRRAIQRRGHLLIRGGGALQFRHHGRYVRGGNALYLGQAEVTVLQRLELLLQLTWYTRANSTDMEDCGS